MNPYELAREERIKRNNAMLAQLEVRQHAEKLAAPIAAAQEAEAKKLAVKRAQLAAVEPRQRSTRGSAAQAKKALSKQAKALQRDSDDSSGAESSDESQALSDDGKSTGKGRKRKADADQEDDYDPLADHWDVQNADSSASEAEDEDSARSSDDPESTERPPARASRSKGSTQRQNRSVEQRAQSRHRAKVSKTAYTLQSGSEEDDYELQQALAMSLLDSRVPAVGLPKSAHRGPAEPQAAQAGPFQAGPLAQLGGNVEEEASATVKTEASEQPASLTLDVEDIKSAVADARLDRKRPGESLIAATLPKSPSTATAAKGKAAHVKAAGAHAKKAVAVSAKLESGAQRGKKKPAKGKAIEIYDPAHIGRAFDMMSSGASSVREHNLQKVWADVRGGKLETVMCNNMMTCAADITNQDTLDRAAFAKLCEHFTQA